MLSAGRQGEVPRENGQAQVQCAHPFEDIMWGANASSVYASCKRCDLKACILYRKMSYEPKIKAKGQAIAVHMVIDAQSR